MHVSWRRLKWACYTTNITMSVIGHLSPVLFLTFRTQYGISYSMLGFLVLVNFVTQLGVDIVFSFFSHRFPISRTVRFTPVCAAVGLMVYGIWPFLFPQAVYAGLVLGTVLFAASGGLTEVLISPVIAAIPSENPDREVSKLHSVYAWGVVGFILFATLFLFAFGNTHWQYLALVCVLAPATSAVLFSRAEVPAIRTPERASGAVRMLRDRGVWLCVLAIFLGGASECAMSQWSSSYLEQALGMDKIWGDVFGVALFAAMLGLGRTLYAKRGRHAARVLFVGAVGAALCYLTAALSPVPVVGLMACALTGLCTSMLWPGSLMIAAARFPAGGVFIYAMMAAGGDLGASIGSQLVGLVTDAALQSTAVAALAERLALAPEQLCMKLGLLTGMLFPAAAIPLYHVLMKREQPANEAPGGARRT